MQTFFYEVRLLPGGTNEYVLERVHKKGTREVIRQDTDSEEWQKQLSMKKTFRFDGKNGSFSALREERKNKDRTVRGRKAYWSAYRKANNAQAKKYIGQDLSIANLEKAAAALTDSLKSKLGIDASDKLHTTRRLHAGSPEKQKIDFLLDQNEKLTSKVKKLEAEIIEKDRIIQELSSSQLPKKGQTSQV